MNCFFLWVPFFLIRFGLMSCLDKSAVRRAAQFAPMRGPEKAAYWVYQLSTAALILHSPFLRVGRESTYRYSRNPMYVAYFVCFLGMALLSRSAAFLVILALFQISCHWIILAEERWCIETFSAAYLDYMRTVRRYL